MMVWQAMLDINSGDVLLSLVVPGLLVYLGVEATSPMANGLGILSALVTHAVIKRPWRFVMSVLFQHKLALLAMAWQRLVYMGYTSGTAAVLREHDAYACQQGAIISALAQSAFQQHRCCSRHYVSRDHGS
jgi:hypothetical protein